MALEEPEVRIDVELRFHDTLADRTAFFRNLGDAIKHQHRRQGQLGVSGTEHLSAGAGEQPLHVETRFACRVRRIHGLRSFRPPLDMGGA